MFMCEFNACCLCNAGAPGYMSCGPEVGVTLKKTNGPSSPSWCGPNITDKRMNGHPPLLQAMWLNWTNCSHDDMYRSPLNIWNVSRSSLISSFLHCAGAPLNYGNTKGQAFGLLVPDGCIWGPCDLACPLLLCDCVSAAWSVVTLRRHYPHHCASLPLCTGNQLWQPWPSNRIGPVTLWPPAIKMVLKSTTITCRPLDYCINTLDIDTKVFCFCPSISSTCLISSGSQ